MFCVVFVNVYSCKIMHACGVTGFSLRDITHPERKRLMRQLSALINFAKFREERMVTFAALSQESVSWIIHQEQKENVLCISDCKWMMG